MCVEGGGGKGGYSHFFFILPFAARTFREYQAPPKTNVGHYGHRHFGLGRFGPDISATDVSATENALGGRFGQIINFGMGCVHA